jgi:hydroxymethylpyrimidine/phosphomethylpyrimidine kinase
MTLTSDKPPVVMIFAGADPTGGAGIAADIQAVSAMGCHPAPIVTAVTAQDTAGLKEYQVVDTELLIAQARAVLEDMPVAAFKTGMLGNAANLAAVQTIINDYPSIPLVVDPVLTTGTGVELSEQPLEDGYRTLLLPHTTLVTPNSIEMRRLAANADSPEACAQELMSLGCEFVLCTGSHEPTDEVVHHLFGHHRMLETVSQQRLPHDFHGSGCTLAAACAAGLAQGFEVAAAVREALAFTWNSLAKGHQLGMGQYLPDRQYWATRDPNNKSRS